ncbi:MAG TPA: Rieske 2Fe-2S domain-containing protein [Longimicrobiaceae bacterium]|nr:Rieske 2Fe-2S domain-containing protein [Longimicrobiaceae bacterium]
MTLRIDTSALPVDTIRPVSPTICVARTCEGVFAFARSCPHAGADLSTGYVHGRQVRCAWHNLPFDPATGRQPCRSLADLRVFPLKQLGPELFELEEPNE